mgnify:CR=1 FL=1
MDEEDQGGLVAEECRHEGLWILESGSFDPKIVHWPIAVPAHCKYCGWWNSVEWYHLYPRTTAPATKENDEE